jgi:hypothetical protein
MSLPPELRNEIYAYAFIRGTFCVYKVCGELWGTLVSTYARAGLPLAFLRTCQLVHDEALPFLYYSNCFLFPSIEDTWTTVHLLLRAIGRRARALINDIGICLPGPLASKSWEIARTVAWFLDAEGVSFTRLRFWLPQPHVLIQAYSVDTYGLLALNHSSEPWLEGVLEGLRWGERAANKGRSQKMVREFAFVRKSAEVILEIDKKVADDVAERCGIVKEWGWALEKVAASERR